MRKLMPRVETEHEAHNNQTNTSESIRESIVTDHVVITWVSKVKVGGRRRRSIFVVVRRSDVSSRLLFLTDNVSSIGVVVN